MSVTVDHEVLDAGQLELRTVGQVLAHVQQQKDKRVVVQVLIDGQEPDLDQLAELRQSPLTGRTLYIETAEPRDMACDVLAQAAEQLAEGNQCRIEAIELLQQNQPIAALEKLGACFTIWQYAQEAVQNTAQLLQVDLTLLQVDDRPLQGLLEEFAEQLRQIKSALENRDFVLLSDILTYEAAETCTRWQAAIGALRERIG